MAAPKAGYALGTNMKIGGAAIGGLLGWIVGVWGYFLALKLQGDDGVGGIHVGALLLGATACTAGAVAGFRLGSRRER